MPKADSDLSSLQPEVRGVETGQFKVPDGERTFAENLKERQRIKKCKGKVMVMRPDEKTKDLEGHISALPKRTRVSRQLKMPKMMEERANKLDLERKRIVLEEALMKSRSDKMRIDKAIVAKERRLKDLQIVLETENSIKEQVFKRSAEARALFAKEKKSRQEKKSAIEKLTKEKRTTERELAELDETLNELKRPNDSLWTLLQSFKGQKALKAGVTNPQLDSDSSVEKLELYFSDPQEVLDLRTKLTEQILSLTQHTNREKETLVELQQTTETTAKKLNEGDEARTLQVNNMTDIFNTEKARAGRLKKMVQLHDSIAPKDQDMLLDALGAKVTEVHGMDRQLTELSTLEKLSSIEYRISSLLERIESIPEENLKKLRLFKDSERRRRLHEQELRLERERPREKEKKCRKRYLGESKKQSVRKLMPKSILIKQKINVSDEDIIPAEDDLHAYLFGSLDAE